MEPTGFILTLTGSDGQPVATISTEVQGPWEGGQGRVDRTLNIVWADDTPDEHYVLPGFKADLAPLALAHEALTAVVWKRIERLKAEAEAAKDAGAGAADPDGGPHRPNFAAALPHAA